MQQNEQNKNLDIFSVSILRIMEMGFLINEELSQEGKEAHVEFSMSTSFNIKTNTAYFNLRTHFHYPDITLEHILFGITLESAFLIPDLKRFTGRGKHLNLPPDVLISLVGLCVTHSRALLSKHTAGTVYQETFIPIVDSVEMTQHLFPNIFKAPKKAKTADKAISLRKGK